MKTQIQYRRTNGDNGVALVHGPVSSLEHAKQELANTLNLPTVDAADGERDFDSKLRNGGIDPSSITFDQLSE